MRLPVSALRALSLLVFAALVSLSPLSAQSPVPVSTPATEPAPAPSPAVAAVVENSVVKIFSTVRGPDQTRPWSKQSPREATGSGVVIEGRRILTNAHVVAYASQIQVQGNQSGEKIPATVEAISSSMDLAVLKLEDESFFDARPALPRATTLPAIKDAVLTYGFPTGGSSLAITKGIVSRIEFTNYSFPASGLRIQIDAAINPGNSGGPALSGDKVIGLAFSRLGGGDNIGYIIPTEEIELFLKDVADGRYDGKPMMFDELQPLQNPALRAFLKVEKAVTGILVTQPDETSADYPLKTWDVITKIGDTSIDDEGMIKLGDNLRVRFLYLIQSQARNGRVPLTIVRQGKSMPIELPVKTTRTMLIASLDNEYPPYFVYGPLVFSIPSSQLLSVSTPAAANVFNSWARAGSPLVTRRSERPAFEGEQLVMVSAPMLPHKLGRGYTNPVMRVVHTINGKQVKNLAHLVELLRDNREEFIVFDFAGRESDSIVLARSEVAVATEDLLNDNGIRAQGSPHLLEIWNAKK
jgi:S1-C subfamily serine protease